jgi:hypothetical protein
MAFLKAISYQNESRYYYHPNGILNIINPKGFLEKERIVINNNKIHFLLCGSCFWCASHFNNTGNTITTTKCPSCDNNKVQSIPLSDNEFYKFDYDPKHAVTLQFSKVDEDEMGALN